MAIEIVDFPMKNGGSFHSYVSSPEGISHEIPLKPIKPPFSYGFPMLVHQRVTTCGNPLHPVLQMFDGPPLPRCQRGFFDHVFWDPGIPGATCCVSFIHSSN